MKKSRYTEEQIAFASRQAEGRCPPPSVLHLQAAVRVVSASRRKAWNEATPVRGILGQLQAELISGRALQLRHEALYHGRDPDHRHGFIRRRAGLVADDRGRACQPEHDVRLAYLRIVLKGGEQVIVVRGEDVQRDPEGVDRVRQHRDEGHVLEGELAAAAGPIAQRGNLLAPMPQAILGHVGEREELSLSVPHARPAKCQFATSRA